MNDNRPAAEIISFPSHKIVRKNPKQEAALVAQQEKQESLETFMVANQEFQDVLMQGFEHFGVDTRSEEFKKDFIVVQSILAAVLSRETKAKIKIPIFSDLLESIIWENATMPNGLKVLKVKDLGVAASKKTTKPKKTAPKKAPKTKKN